VRDPAWGPVWVGLGDGVGLGLGDGVGSADGVSASGDGNVLLSAAASNATTPL
jgi:hypothetical protein